MRCALDSQKRQEDYLEGMLSNKKLVNLRICYRQNNVAKKKMDNLAFGALKGIGPRSLGGVPPPSGSASAGGGGRVVTPHERNYKYHVIN